MEINTSKKYNFHVHGMHCNACSLLIESELGDYPGVKRVAVARADNTIEIIGDFGNMSQEEIATMLSAPIKNNGYSLSTEKRVKERNLSEFKIAVPIAIGFAVIFVLLQKIGLLNLVGNGNVTLGTAFIIGIIASLSTCIAVVGGLVLSLSATFAKQGDRVRPQLLFHVGRLVSFFILGGVIGTLGSAFTLSTSMTFILSIVIGLVMLILGINLLDTFLWSKRFQPSMPKFISKRAHGIVNLNHTYTPLLVGIATFFLPCGFTQSMQLFTLGTGSFTAGALTMFSFALGTLPVLALVSFSSFSIQNNAKKGIFFKSAGLIVILFALFNIINSLAIIGIIPPLFNF
jgi:sulfite exporter TauE/SafE/copper chaperone CopZ